MLATSLNYELGLLSLKSQSGDGRDEERGRDHPQHVAKVGLHMVPKGGEQQGKYYLRRRGDCLRQ